MGEKIKYERFTLKVPLVKISARIKHRQGHLDEVLSIFFFFFFLVEIILIYACNTAVFAVQ